MTKALYQDNTYLYECEAVVRRVEQSAAEGKYDLILDQTVFYPQGGGQPSDKGIIEHPLTGAVFIVEKVTKCRESNEIIHHGYFQSGSLYASERVQCKIDEALRILHSRYHLAGHVIDLAMVSLQADKQWRASSGNHSPTGAYIEYISVDEDGNSIDSVKSLVGELEKKCNELICMDFGSRCIQYKPCEVPEHCRSMLKGGLESMELVRIHRVDSFDQVWIPCGGTLGSRLGEVGRISITKHSFKKGLLRICYALA
jgi:alanyl-tRNA synthetase